MAKVAVLGYGTVGSGVVDILINNQSLLENRIGSSIELGYILEVNDAPEVSFKDKFTNNYINILSDPEVKVVAEAIGGMEPAFTFIKQALKAGKHVATANKELVAEKGAELLALAKENNVRFLFEASVGGGIPIIRPMHQCLVANNILSIKGILNGTSNFILTKMKEEGMAFADALDMAQELGYAEADPTDDVDGIDALRKICILASYATGEHVYPNGVYTKGIRKISGDDVKAASKAGMAIKLIGKAVPLNGKVAVSVEPRVLRQGEMLGYVNDAFNAVEFIGDFVGPVFLNGYGAGKDPTGSALVSDIIEGIQRGNCPSSLTWKDSDGDNVVDIMECDSQFFVRYKGDEDEIISHFVDGEILDASNEIVFITPVRKRCELEEMLEGLKGQVLSYYPMATKK